MKIMNKMTGSIAIISLTLLTGSAAHAGVANMVGTWIGTGATFNLDGTTAPDYQVELDATLQSDGSVANAVTVTIPGSPVRHFEQVLRDTPKGFSMSSSDGSGGAICLGDGLCEGFFGDANGNGMALTLILDGTDTFRTVKTELRNSALKPWNKSNPSNPI